MPWYVIWMLPFAALSQRRAPRAAAIALTVLLFAMWAPAGVTKLHNMGWHGPHSPTAHANTVYKHRLLR